MQNFEQWLENKADIKYGSFWKDGTVTVYIDGTRYEYQTDPMYHDRWQKMARYSPFKVLHEIKKLINLGQARQITQVDPMNLDQKFGKIKKIRFNKNNCPHCQTAPPHYVPGIECPGCGLNNGEGE